MLFLSRFLVLICSMKDAYFHDSCNFVRPLFFFLWTYKQLWKEPQCKKAVPSVHIFPHCEFLKNAPSGTGKPGRLLSMGSHRVGHELGDLAAAAAVVNHSQSLQLPSERKCWESDPSWVDWWFLFIKCKELEAILKLFFQRKVNVRVLKAVVGGGWGLHLMIYKGHGFEDKCSAK